MKTNSTPRLVARFLLSGYGLLCCGLVGFGQDSSATSPVDSAENVIRVNTRLVEVDVMVRNRTGPITDLSREDFVLTDNGTPQEISTFVVNLSQGYRRTRIPLRPGEISNRVNPRGEETSGATVVLIDGLNTSPADQSQAQKDLLTYLRSLQRGSQFALYGLTRGLGVIQDFTDDPDLLIEAAQNANAEFSFDLGVLDLTEELRESMEGGSGDAGTDAMMENAIKQLGDFGLRNRAEITTRALEEIARHLSGLPGRKKLVWVTGGFPAVQTETVTLVSGQHIESLSFEPQINRAVRALNDANIAVYPIDARGLTLDGLLAPNLDSMNLIASGTGGRATYAVNDLEGSIRTVVEDTEVTYTLGFYPSGEELDGGFHNLNVKLTSSNRSRDADLRFRKGYYARELSPPTEKQRETAIKEAFQVPLNATGIGLAGIAVPLMQDPSFSLLEVTINLNELSVAQQDGKYVANVTFATHFFDSQEGGNPRGTDEGLRIALNEDRFLEAMQNGFRLQRLLDVGDKTGVLEVVVQDKATGGLGSLRIPLVGNRFLAQDDEGNSPSPQ